MTVTVIEGLFEGTWVPLSRVYFKSQMDKATQRLKSYQRDNPAREYRLAEYQRLPQK